MGIDIKINIDFTARQKKIVRAAVVTGAAIAALGIGVAIADINTNWITDGGVVSASSLQANLNGLQWQIDDGGMSLQGQISTLQGQVTALQAFQAQATADGGYSLGATFCGATSITTNGQITNGYAGAKALCQAVSGCSPTAAHMCTTEEMVRTQQVSGKMIPNGYGWVSNGSFGYFPSPPASRAGTFWDCSSWTSSSDTTLSQVWDNNSSGSPFVYFDYCSNSNPILCCD